MTPSLLDRYLARRYEGRLFPPARPHGLAAWLRRWEYRQIAARATTPSFQIALAQLRGAQRPGRDTLFDCPRCHMPADDDGCWNERCVGVELVASL